MSERKKKRTRKIFIVALVGSLGFSMMYVSFAFGFRAGIMEDTVYILPNC